MFLFGLVTDFNMYSPCRLDTIVESKVHTKKSNGSLRVKNSDNLTELSANMSISPFFELRKSSYSDLNVTGLKCKSCTLKKNGKKIVTKVKNIE